MRRLPSLLLLVVVLALLVVAPVNAQPAPSGTELWIAVPDTTILDGVVDRVSFTGFEKLGTAYVSSCFQPAGDYPLSRVVIFDETAGARGVVDGVLVKGHTQGAYADVEITAGTRAESLTMVYSCTEGGIHYHVYFGVVCKDFDDAGVCVG